MSTDWIHLEQKTTTGSYYTFQKTLLKNMFKVGELDFELQELTNKNTFLNYC